MLHSQAGLGLELALVAVSLGVTAAHRVVLHGAHPGARVLAGAAHSLVRHADRRFQAENRYLQVKNYDDLIDRL